MNQFNSYKEITNAVLLYALTAIYVTDNFLLVFIKVKRKEIENKYFKKHLDFGMWKAGIIKFLVFAFVCNSILHPTGSLRSWIPLVIVYAYYVIPLLVEVIGCNAKSST